MFERRLCRRTRVRGESRGGRRGPPIYFSFKSSHRAAYAYPSIVPTPDSATRAPTPQMNPCGKIGATSTRSRAPSGAGGGTLPASCRRALRLPLEQAFAFRIGPVGVDSLLRHERLDARGGVARGAARTDQQATELLLAPRAQERGSLHRAHAGAHADGLQVTGDRLPEWKGRPPIWDCTDRVEPTARCQGRGRAIQGRGACDTRRGRSARLPHRRTAWRSDRSPGRSRPSPVGCAFPKDPWPWRMARWCSSRSRDRRSLA